MQQTLAVNCLLAIYCQMGYLRAMKLCTMNVSLTSKLARHVRSRVGSEFGNASEYIRELLRRGMLAKQEASLSPLSGRDLAEIAAQTSDDPVLVQMARHSVTVSKKARS
jgi:Arc/MetJ-type ribon-helix-helix transcriptional regulator